MKISTPLVLRKLLLLIVLVTGATHLQAQWATYGPVKSDIVNCVATSGANVFAGTQDSGVFISTDNGHHWKAVNTGLKSKSVYQFVIDGSNIFAATGLGVFLTTNNGNSWTEADNGIPANSVVICLMMNGSNLYSGDWSNLDGIYVSSNSGTSWTSASGGIPFYPYIYALGASGNNIFASIAKNAGIYVSTDNGGSWTAAGTGLPNKYVNSIASNGSNIFAGTAGEGIYLSTNNGGSWSAVNNGLTNLGIAGITTDGNNIFACTYGKGVFLSTNNGTNWTSIGLTCIALSVAVNDSNIFVATYDSGVWQRSIKGLLSGIGETPVVSNNTFMLYPNPANNSFEAETNSTEKKLLQVFDITGKLVLTQSINNIRTTIDASNLAEGIYTARLSGSSGVGNKKLIIER